MATIVLAAVGGAAGAGFGGAVLGLSGAVVGQAVGATVGRLIDQRLLGTGSRAVETGRVDRFRLTGASEGAPVQRVWGRVRVGGQVIWATRFVETSSRRRIGSRKTGTTVTEYGYSISLAIDLCEGEIVGVGRVWADGAELRKDSIVMRVYPGDETQMPDPRIEAVEGAGQAPAYRGIAYVVIEDLDLAPFGNRVPQFTFEVLRSAEGAEVPDLMGGVRAVALMPGTGEFALSTEVVAAGAVGGPATLPALPGALMPALSAALGSGRPANVNTGAGATDLAVSLDQLQTELPECRSVLLVVSWFGDDLRCGECAVRPKVENATDAPWRNWKVCGLARAEAQEVPRLDGRAVYGGTPSDKSVLEAIAALRDAGQDVVFYPFLLMEQLAGNSLPNPWTGGIGQPVLPWRGRITASVAPGQPGTPDRSHQAEIEVDAFFGEAQPHHFSISGGEIAYSGPSDDWGYRRFILHYAWLAKLSGGVDAFCVGSELRGLTQLRGPEDVFPAVQALRQLAADVRAVLGAGVRISYAADWSEYFGYLAPDGNRYFHLDPFWADDNVDFIGIDNYMPLSDWRHGEEHADAGWGAIHSLDYLRSNIAGGEGFDWYYASEEDAEIQQRTPITDGSHGEPWIWRYKDLRGWWENPHHERIDGARSDEPTAWVPRSKPFWFTELGCPAVDMGSNEPNAFVDPKSAESRLPKHSRGWRDDTIQQQYHRAMVAHWDDPASNPVSPIYGAPMVDPERLHVWAWDARPFPAFPAEAAVWSDGENWARGHWITGRTAAQPLASVVAEICRRAGVADADVSGLYGVVRGLNVASTELPRSILQTLMLAHGFDAFERDGHLVFRMRNARVMQRLAADRLVAREGGAVEFKRASEPEVAGRVRLVHVEAEADFEVRAVEASLADDPTVTVAQTDLPMVLTDAEAQGLAERWLAEARIAKDTARFSLAPSSRLGAGDVVELELPGETLRWRIDRAEAAGALEVEAVRVEPGVNFPAEQPGQGPRARSFAYPAPVLPLFLDLPLLTGAEVPHAPHLAVSGGAWQGAAAVFDAHPGEGFRLNRLFERRAAVGFTETPLRRAAPGRWDRGEPLRIRMLGAALQAAGEAAVFAGANAMAIGDGSPERWEILQFASAELIGANLWEVTQRLRGQLGSDALMPDVWPAGSMVVLLDETVGQIDCLLSARGLPRRYRIGPADRPHDDPTYIEIEAAFAGAGLRPYAPVHVRAHRRVEGVLEVGWIRRTRIDGDSWAGVEVPLGEEEERYLVRVVRHGDVLRQVEVGAPSWSYTAAAQAEDGAVPPYAIGIAQLSRSFGPGPFTEIAIDD